MKNILLALLWGISFVSSATGDSFLERIEKIPYYPKAENAFRTYGGSWIMENGIISGKGDFGGRITPAFDLVPEMKSGAIRVRVYIPERKEGFSGLGFKISDSGTGADAYNGYEIGFNPKKKTILIGVHRHDFHPVRTIPFDIPVGKWFSLEVNFTEETFDLQLDGKKIFDHKEKGMKKNDPLRKGSIAFRSWGYPIRFTDLEIRSGSDWRSIPLRERKPADPQTWPDQFSFKELPPILFLERKPLTRPNSVGNDLWQAKPTAPGCRISLIDPAHPDRPVKTIFSDPEGSIYDMNLSWDAKTIFFSYRPKGNHHWNIWKIQTDGSDLQQLTKGPYFDVSPYELPDGGIVFVSTRRFGYTVCQPGPASNLFRMNADGSDLSCISMNTLSDFTPQVLSDGRILFTRWEYIDRDLTYRQSLWTENPDGTSYQLFFGNTIRDVGSFLQARPLPESGTSRVVATFAPHHGYPHGAIGLIDRKFGVEGKKGEGFKYISKGIESIRDRSFEWGYRDPFPLTDDLFLCVWGDGNRSVLKESDHPDPGKRFRIYLLDLEGTQRLLYESPQYSCFYPIPLEAREKPSIPAPRRDLSRSVALLRPDLKKEQISPWDDLASTEGDPAATVVLVNIYHGLESVPKGSVKSIRIMEQIRKTEDLSSRAYDQSPVMSCGTYYAKRNWGTVPVEEDGSAHFYVPALREIYFQALDEKGREIQRMTSAAQFMPGETSSCLGCHEPRDTIPGTAVKTPHRPKASMRKPDLPQLPDWMRSLSKDRTNRFLDAGIVDYPSVVQPVLDKYCISCHQGSNPDGGYDLSGDQSRFFSVSYDALIGKSRSYRQLDMLTGDPLLQTKEQERPLVQFHWLLYTPSAVNRPYESGTLASRLPDYFTKDHCKMEIAKDDLERIYTWIDADIPYYGTYAHSRPNTSGRRDRWAKIDRNEPDDWMSQIVLPYYQKNCSSCHKDLYGGNKDLPGVHDSRNIDWIGRFGWINLTRPENSLFLTSHLDLKEGGRGISIDPKDPNRILFRSKNDPDYKQLLNAFQKGKDQAEKCPEADRPGFVNARPEP